MSDPGWERPPKMLRTPPLARIRPVPGEGAIRPLEGAFSRPPLAESGIGGNFSPGTPRADGSGGRGMVVVPRGGSCGARDSQLFFFVKYDVTGMHVFKDQFRHHHPHHHHHYQGALYNKD